MRKIAVYGGSFNPIHNGHLWIAQQISEHYPFDQIWFLVSNNGSESCKKLISIDNRVKMATLALNEFKNKKFKVITSLYNYTYENLNKFKKDSPEDDFTIVLGSDQTIEKFKDFKIYKTKFNSLLVKRSSNNIPKVKTRWDILHFNLSFDISSTEIRKRIINHQIISGLIPKSVERYILRNSIYDDMYKLT